MMRSDLKRALIVDDDDMVRLTVGAMMRHLDFDVQEASNGEAAVAFILDSPFDIIVTDLFMPEFDGVELILRIRELTSDTPIILMTGGGRHFPNGSDGLEGLVSAAEAFGATGIIHKPFRKQEFSKVVSQVMDQKRP